MPYYRCAGCDLTVYAGVGHSTGHVCPGCGADLAAASRVFVREVAQPDLHLDMVREPQAAAAARRELEALFGGLDRAELEVASLLSTELVANSVKHAGPRAGGLFGLDVSITDDSVRVMVTDGGRGFTPDPRTHRDLTAGHWGLLLVEELADRWGVDCNERTAVWFELDRAPAPV